MVNLLFLAGLVTLTGLDEVVYAIPRWFIALLIIGLIAAIMTINSAAMATPAWKNGRWRLAGRVHYIHW